VARIGVGYDAVDVPALTARRIPLMVAGIANSVSVAEQAMFFMMTLAKRRRRHGQHGQGGSLAGPLGLGRLRPVRQDRADRRFGRIGTRSAKRCQAMEMTVLIHDPYVPAATIKAAGASRRPTSTPPWRAPTSSASIARKNKETVGMFDAARLAKLKPTAYLVNTARGGIIDEPALHAALTKGQLAGRGLDVFDLEPTPADNPLLKLANVITAPHMAGVTRESLERMAEVTVATC